MSNYCKKYAPINLKTIIGNKAQINYLTNWLNNFENNKKSYLKHVDAIQLKKQLKKHKKKLKISEEDSNNINDIDEVIEVVENINIKKTGENSKNHSCLMMIGEHGVGKTCLTNVVLKNMNYIVDTINIQNILCNNKNISSYIKNLLTSHNIFEHLNNELHKRHVIVIDELESLNSPLEKKIITYLINLNNELWSMPIIFISGGKHSKITTLLKVHANIINFNYPTYDNLMTLLIRVCKNENISFENEKTAQIVLNNSQFDYRRLLSILQDMQQNNTDLHFDDKKINTFFATYKKKDLDVNIFRSSAFLMAHYNNIDECLRLYNSEKITIPLVLHQNYINFVNANYYGKDRLDICATIAKSFAFGDLVSNNIYSDQNWDMEEIYGFSSCVYPSYLLSKLKIRTNEEFLKKSLEYPKDFSKTSVKNINKKNINKTLTCLKNFEIMDFMHANSFIKTLFQNNKIAECADIFKNYNGAVEHIEAILKIDKIVDTKNIIPSSIKSQLTQLFKQSKIKK